jgi:hypothetical protein
MNISRIARCHHGILSLVRGLVVVARSDFSAASQPILLEGLNARHSKWSELATSSHAQLIAEWVTSATGVPAAQIAAVASSLALPQLRYNR